MLMKSSHFLAPVFSVIPQRIMSCFKEHLHVGKGEIRVPVTTIVTENEGTIPSESQR